MIHSIANLSPSLAYVTTFFLMASNGAINFPSSQLLYLFLGFLTTYGTFSQTLFVFFGAVGNILGNILIYELVRKNSKHPLSHIKKVPKEKQEKVLKLIEKHGVLYIFFGKMIPAVKVLIPIAAGLTKIKRVSVYIAFSVSSFLWATIYTTIGRYFGEHATFTKYYSSVVLVLVLTGYYITYRNYPELFTSLTEKEIKSKNK